MKRLLHFGLQKSMNCSDSGALLSCEIEEIIDFLCRDGLLVAKFFDSFIVISHPRLVEKIKAPLVNAGLQPLLFGATLSSLRRVTSLTLAENRVMELLSPGSLIIARDENLLSDTLPVALPDDCSLRDIASSFNGTLQVFIWRGQGGLTEFERVLRSLDREQCSFNMIGVLDSSYLKATDTRITIAKIIGPGDVQCIVNGTIDLNTIKEASRRVSVWEVEDWT